ncbi:hypothetical protein NDU88_000810 [Pleurodeles waltl]|uniref:Uncharacterized protein n=1 Tax=Pleurodeles waltl TaxID=8319 RepID=A0AAV7SB47_PLEWA|nr:hypothetical protein NDU88_000810 [Pleurodeles waltl]
MSCCTGVNKHNSICFGARRNPALPFLCRCAETWAACTGSETLAALPTATEGDPQHAACWATSPRRLLRTGCLREAELGGFVSD